MIQKGQTIENPVTGERMTFIETSESTSGEYVLIELRADPGGAVAAAHLHPSQWERFEVVSGTLGAKVGGKEIDAGPGQVVGVAPGTAHTWRPRSPAHDAVLAAPLRAPASTTTVAAANAATRRLRARNWRRVGLVPGGYSLTIRPLRATRCSSAECPDG